MLTQLEMTNFVVSDDIFVQLINHELILELIGVSFFELENWVSWIKVHAFVAGRSAASSTLVIFSLRLLVRWWNCEN
jgi:hypothetical protein